jgi:cyclophilin family peptidyl-prolyl cis-trans isomerase
LLRNGLPIAPPPELRALQETVEDAKKFTEKQEWAKAAGTLSRAEALVKNTAPFIKGMPKDKLDVAKAIADQLPGNVKLVSEKIAGGEKATKASLAADIELAREDALDQEEATLSNIGRLETLLVGDGLPFKVPSEYSSKLPVLNGRAKVEMVLRKTTEGKFEIRGKPATEAKVVLTLDGYNAPVTAGNFVDLVKRGFYNGMKIQRSDGFVVQTGASDTPEKGFVDSSGQTRRIPLEVFIRGDKEPLYSASPDEAGRKRTVAALPFQSTGALGMARSEFDNDSASSQWFWLLYDSELTPAGRNLLDGRYSCFGYTTEGQDYLRSLVVGDEIVSAKIIEGEDNLQQPS